MSVELTHPDALVVSIDWPNNHRQIQAILFTSATIYLWNSLQFIYSGFQTGEGARLPQRGFDLCQHTVLKIDCDHKGRLDIFLRSQTKDRFTRVWFPVTLVTLFSTLVPQISRSSTLLLFIWELFTLLHKNKNMLSSKLYYRKHYRVNIYRFCHTIVKYFEGLPYLISPQNNRSTYFRWSPDLVVKTLLLEGWSFYGFIWLNSTLRKDKTCRHSLALPTLRRAVRVGWLICRVIGVLLSWGFII